MLMLRKELDRKNISVKAYANFLGLSEKAARNKLNGDSEFSFGEALATKRGLFPEFEYEYLFSKDEAAS